MRLGGTKGRGKAQRGETKRGVGIENRNERGASGWKKDTKRGNKKGRGMGDVDRSEAKRGGTKEVD